MFTLICQIFNILCFISIFSILSLLQLFTSKKNYFYNLRKKAQYWGGSFSKGFLRPLKVIILYEPFRYKWVPFWKGTAPMIAFVPLFLRVYNQHKETNLFLNNMSSYLTSLCNLIFLHAKFNWDFLFWCKNRKLNHKWA